ncbi:MAG TPA: endolytic transglycosylase MltG [Sporichthyaceae bacterium]
MTGTMRHRRSRAKALAAVLIAILAVGVIGISSTVGFSRVVHHFTENTADFSGPAGPEKDVKVIPGSSLRTIGRLLAESGVVKSQGAFVNAAKSNSKSASIAPGTYKLAEHLSGKDAVSRLLDPQYRILAHVVVPEGRTSKEIIAALVAATGIGQDKFDAALKTDYGLPEWAKNPDGHKSEGFLFPATYDFEPDATATSILAAFTKRFKQAATSTGLNTKTGPQNLTPFQVLTVASLVQAEAKRPEDMPKIAQVIYNRLTKGMPLQLDTTVLYANGGIRAITTTAAQRSLDSPYNTYKVSGLPPGPINSPGEAAINAALNPTAGPWLFFVAINPQTGETRFAVTGAEHAQNVALFQQWLRDHPNYH